MSSKENKLSIFWIVFSMIIFIVTEILIGSAIEKYVSGFMSISLRFMLMGLVNLGAYFLGGFLIGAISRKRVWEPPIGAFFCVFLMYLITFFVPITFYQFTLSKLVVAGIIAFVTTLVGSSMGEHFTSKLRSATSSKEQINELNELKSQYFLGEDKQKGNGWSYEKKENKNFIS